MRYHSRIKKSVFLLLLIIGVKIFVVYYNAIFDFPNIDISTVEVVKSKIKTEEALNANNLNLKSELIIPTESIKGPEVIENSTETPKLNLTNRDGLSIYTWRGLCTDQLDKLKAYPGFPLYPDVESSTSSSAIQLNIDSFGLRIFGYLIPNKSGEYQFKIAAINSEIWLSTGSDPNKLELIAKTDTISDVIILHAHNGYFIEIITVSSEIMDALIVYWRVPGGEEYKEINQQFLAHYPSSEIDNLQHLPSHETQFKLNTLNDPREKFPLMNRLPSEMYPILPNCSQATDGMTPKEVLSMNGLWSVNENEIALSLNSNTDQPSLHGAPAMNDQEANRILQSFISLIGNNSGELIKDFTIVNLEKSFSDMREDQYLLEGMVTLHKSPKESYLLSQTILVENGALCIPTKTPNLTAFVHIVIIVKDQRRWIRYFLENVNNIYTQTNDQRFGVMIVDFNSRDIDVNETMRRTLKLKHYKFISMDGPFNKVRGQNMAIDSVSNPNDIIFTCDLHLNIPMNMIESIRKHTTQGISVYTPLLRRLNCGVISFDGPGKWEDIGYGLVSMFKTDWEAIGGMSVEFGEKWGGEDWDLVDRVLRIGYHIHRLRMPALVHFYHLKEGAWYIAI